MCGIAGFTWSDKNLLEKMTNKLAHRGPDAEGFYVDKNISLGHRRLEIIDLSDRANQPLFNEDGSLILVCNGEIYNYKDLRGQLISKGHQFYTECDTEVILHLFEEYHIQSFELLNGMFAFALYDKKNSELFLIVDHLAIKNIYYSSISDNLIFASECKAILASEKIGRDINEKVLQNIITYGYNPNSETPFKQIRLMEPGTFLHKTQNSLVIRKYHQFKEKVITYSSRGLYELLDHAVRERVTADVPIAFLSGGGLDSSAIVALAAKYISHPRLFSLGFSKENNEFYYSRILADKFKLDYTEILLENFDIYSEISKALYFQETPQDTGSMLPNWCLAKEIAKNGYKVVLGGDGADETWCGYTRHPGMYDMLNRPEFQNKNVNRLYFDKYIMKQPGNPWFFNEFIEKSSWVDICSFFDVFHEIPYYHNIRLDKMFMAWGIEYRPPFLDRTLVQFSLNIPFKNKIKGSQRKFLLKDAMKDILPKEILQREKQPLKIPQILINSQKWQNTIMDMWKEIYSFKKDEIAFENTSSEKKIA